MPEEWMWPFSELISEHFEEVRYSKGVDNDPKDDRTVVPMVKNEDPRMMALRRR